MRSPYGRAVCLAGTGGCTRQTPACKIPRTYVPAVLHPCNGGGSLDITRRCLAHSRQPNLSGGDGRVLSAHTLALSDTPHTHTHKRARARARTRTHTHTTHHVYRHRSLARSPASPTARPAWGRHDVAPANTPFRKICAVWITYREE